ncbi:SWIM-type domain-containing protein [Mycena indigotica]|uniref:SWIM-type domain-containing protein n=1 Tax=Mycena indigotica TaxID=2126181 RepID=A0A8H6S0C8_9AGAR|nr:SWIM-type domain-containing protein [Mycena indigotica]KAF7290614.1 SWIM-type domain-containing protein [Mycena indigotica]
MDSSDTENIPPALSRCTGTNCSYTPEPGRQKCARCLEQNRQAAKKRRELAKKQKKGDGPSPRKKLKADGPQAGTAHIHVHESDSESEPEDMDSATEGDLTSYEAKVSLTEDAESDPRERVKAAAMDAWKASGFRFTVHRHKQLKTGHSTIYWCSQDRGRKKQSKPTTKPDAKHRETPVMNRYPCKSRLAIACHRGGNADGRLNLYINFKHAIRHMAYRDTSMPADAIEFIHNTQDGVSPSDLADTVTELFKNVSRAQALNIWREKMEKYYKRDDNQLKSAAILLREFGDDVDIFELVGVPADVEVLAWGMKKIAGPLRGIVEETAMDATYNTNSRNLELYAIMGELDNAPSRQAQENWGNWYRKGRWELWVRSAHPTIPRLRTTMICESHWRKLKQDYLHEYHSPRLDLLVWIILTKLCKTYTTKLTKFLTPSCRTRMSELSSWRDTFRKTWRSLEKRDISDRVHDTYRPDVTRWVCSCPAFLVSRFLLCKHLVQRVQVVPATFFREVKRRHTVPFWQHPALIPLHDGNDGPALQAPGANLPQDLDVPEDEDEDDDQEPSVYIETAADREFDASAATFEAEFDREIQRMEEFLAGLKYQKQFRDRRMLDTLQKKGSGFFRLAQACLVKERKAQSTSGQAAQTWDPQLADAMYYRPRPRVAERDT